MKKTNLFLIPLLAIHLLILSQLQFRAWPEMVSFPYLINHGFILYKDAIHAYPPLLVTCLAILFKIFGYKLIVLKLFGWISILISNVLIYKILKKMISDPRLVIGGVLVYVVLQPILEGNMVWPDLFMVPFLLGSLLLTINKKYFYAGLAAGFAILTKQTALAYIVCSMVYIVFNTKKLKTVLTFTSGIVIAVLPLLVILVSQNSVQDFLNWTLIYPSTFWTRFPGYVNLNLGLRNLSSLVVLLTPLVFLLIKMGKKVSKDQYFLLLFGFLLCGVVGVYPRFSFFHLQPALAFNVILLIYLLNKTKVSWYYLLLIPILILVINFKSLQFGEARFWGKSDVELAKKIQYATPNDKPVYLLGLNSNLYALSDRQPNKAWLDNFGWYLEHPGVQAQVIKFFEKDAPAKIFWRTPDTGNWYDLGVYQPMEITDWIKKNYTITGEIQKGITEWSRR